MDTIEKHPKATSVGRDILVGKDILELLSGAMYIEPLTFYREYIQNSTDAIDEAKHQNPSRNFEGRINIEISCEKRAIKIRDNGIGIPRSSFVRRLTSFGGSSKRGSNARGFRGVGRVSGLGYCQTLIMRSKSKGEDVFSEMIWDCVKLKEELRAVDQNETLGQILEKAVTYRHVPCVNVSAHFFEIEMLGVVRVKADALLNPVMVNNYLSQVGPVPFPPEFKYSKQIDDFLAKHSTGASYNIYINDSEEPITRPFFDKFEIFKNESDRFSEVQFLELSGLNDLPSAVGWILHHSYKGALPSGLKFKGLRLRKGNIQVGREFICEELFQEPRFNSWTVGEIHVIDSKIYPNGRRDAFEHNAHYANLVGHLTLTAKQLSKKCRQMSAERAKKDAANSAAQQGKLINFLPPKKKAIVENLDKRKFQKVVGVLSALSKFGLDNEQVKELCGSIINRLVKI